MSDSGAPPKPLFPKLWPYYDGVMATIGFLLISINVLIGGDVFPDAWTDWVNIFVAGLTAFMIWLRNRAVQLGVARTTTDHLQDDDNGQHRKPE